MPASSAQELDALKPQYFDDLVHRAVVAENDHQAQGTATTLVTSGVSSSASMMLFLVLAALGHGQGDGITHKEGHQRRHKGDAQRTDEHLQVIRVQEADEVVQIGVGVIDQAAARDTMVDTQPEQVEDRDKKGEQQNNGARRDEQVFCPGSGGKQSGSCAQSIHLHVVKQRSVRWKRGRGPSGETAYSHENIHGIFSYSPGRFKFRSSTNAW